MTNFADWEDLHFDAAPVEFDDRWDGFEDESDWEYEMQFGGEDSFLDSYWEGEAEAAFWGGE